MRDAIDINSGKFGRSLLAAIADQESININPKTERAKRAQDEMCADKPCSTAVFVVSTSKIQNSGTGVLKSLLLSGCLCFVLMCSVL